MNNGGSGQGGSNAGGNVGVDPNTPISDTEAWCLTDNLLATLEDILENAILDAVGSKQLGQRWCWKLPVGGVQKILSILGGLSGVMTFPVNQKYATTEVFNRSGPVTGRSNQGRPNCRWSSWLYPWSTLQHHLGCGALGGGGGGGSVGNPGNPGGPNWGDVTGGLPIDHNISPGQSVCQDAETGKIL